MIEAASRWLHTTDEGSGEGEEVVADGDEQELIDDLVGGDDADEEGEEDSREPQGEEGQEVAQVRP